MIFNILFDYFDCYDYKMENYIWFKFWIFMNQWLEDVFLYQVENEYIVVFLWEYDIWVEVLLMLWVVFMENGFMVGGYYFDFWLVKFWGEYNVFNVLFVIMVVLCWGVVLEVIQ